MRLQFLLKKQVFLKVQNPCRPGRIRRKALSGSLLGRIRATPRGWGARHTSVEKFHTCAPTGRPGGVLPPLPLHLFRAPQPSGRAEPFYRTAGRAAGRSLSTPASEVFLRRPGGAFPPLLPRLFRAPQQDNRTEPFTGRSGERPGGAFPPLPPGLFRAPQQGNRTEPFTGRPGGRPEALRHPVPMPCGGGCAEPARRRSRKGRK